MSESCINHAAGDGNWTVLSTDAVKLQMWFAKDKIETADPMRRLFRHEIQAHLVKWNLMWKKECSLESFFTRAEGEWSH